MHLAEPRDGLVLVNYGRRRIRAGDVLKLMGVAARAIAREGDPRLTWPKADVNGFAGIQRLAIGTGDAHQKALHAGNSPEAILADLLPVADRGARDSVHGCHVYESQREFLRVVRVRKVGSDHHGAGGVAATAAGHEADHEEKFPQEAEEQKAL